MKKPQWTVIKAFAQETPVGSPREVLDVEILRALVELEKRVGELERRENDRNI